MRPPELILASASPRRLALLRGCGLEPTVRPTDVDEAVGADERPADAAVRLARAKAAGVDGAAPGAIVLAADTIVEIDGEALGKPRDAAEARSMLVRLSGRSHRVHTGVCCRRSRAEEVADVVSSTVTMVELSDEEIGWYVATGEGRDKAGGYAVQGRAAIFIRAIEGSYTNVVGLPLDLVYVLLGRLGGVELARLLRPSSPA